MRIEWVARKYLCLWKRTLRPRTGKHLCVLKRTLRSVPAPLGTLKCEDAGREKVLVKASHPLTRSCQAATDGTRKTRRAQRPFVPRQQIAASSTASRGKIDARMTDSTVLVNVSSLAPSPFW